MRYLFFDIECCNGKNICEFGYVLTDENFQIIEKHDYTINPQAKFNLTGRTDNRDIHLYFSEAVYYRSPLFSFYYDKIKELLEYSEQIVIGHSVVNDAGFIRTACRRYGLPPINFAFCDSQKIYSEYSGSRKNIALEKATKEFSIEPPKHLHKSDDDSEGTMKFVRALCEKMEMSLTELISICPTCTGKSVDFNISFDYKPETTQGCGARKENRKNTMRGKNYNRLLQFLDGVKPQGEIIQSIITGKQLCVSKNYEVCHYAEMLALVQLIVNHGGTYCLKASENDIFVRYDEKDENGNLRFCTRLNYVSKAVDGGKQIDIISWQELLSFLGVSEEALSEMPAPEKSSFLIKNPYEKYFSAGSGSTIGDILKMQGIDLIKMAVNQ